jgi:hypothetical protein
MRLQRVIRFSIAACAVWPWFVTNADALQRVFLDFDSGNDGNINYTQPMRDEVQAIMEGHYARFDVEFFQVAPMAPFSTLTFNEGFSGGLAQQIDFRNLDPDDNAVLNAQGFGDPMDVVITSANIASHELGHILGLRHGDSFGPIGSGLGVTGPPPNSYTPPYPGPQLGDEVVFHIMGTPAIGVNTFNQDHWLGEREATKLEFAETGTSILEAPGPKDTLATAQPITLEEILVPNTIVIGDNAGPFDFSVDALSVVGELSVGGETDTYRFEARAGDLFNFEVMSQAIAQRFSNTVNNSRLFILDETGTPVDYYGTDAFNNNEFETRDSIIIDLFIPADGTYYAQIDTVGNTDTGSYEFFAYRFNGMVPEPSTLVLSLVGGLFLLRNRNQLNRTR